MIDALLTDEDEASRRLGAVSADVFLPTEVREGADALADLLRRPSYERGVVDTERILALGLLEGGREQALPLLSAVRDVLVFVPLAFTWFHLFSALDADRDGGSTDGTTFLQRWQRGFGGEAWPLQDVARWVAGLLVVLVALSLVISLGQRARDAGRQRRIESVRRAAWAADVALVSSAQVEGAGRLGDEAARELAAGLSRSGTSIDRLVAALDTGDGERTAGEVVASLEGIGRGLSAAALRMADDAEVRTKEISELQAVVRAAERSASDLHQRSTRLAEAVDDLIRRTGAEGEAQRALAESVRLSAEVLRADVELSADEAALVRRIVSDIRLLADEGFISRP